MHVYWCQPPLLLRETTWPPSVTANVRVKSPLRGLWAARPRAHPGTQRLVLACAAPRPGRTALTVCSVSSKTSRASS